MTELMAMLTTVEDGADTKIRVTVVAFVGGQQDGYDVRVKAVVVRPDGRITVEWLHSLNTIA